MSTIILSIAVLVLLAAIGGGCILIVWAYIAFGDGLSDGERNTGRRLFDYHDGHWRAIYELGFERGANRVALVKARNERAASKDRLVGVSAIEGELAAFAAAVNASIQAGRERTERKSNG